MLGGARSSRSVIQFSRSGLGQSNQLLDGLNRQRWMHNKHIRLPYRKGDRRKITHRIVRRFLQKRPDPKNASREKQGITIRQRFGHGVARDNPARSIVYYHLLAQG